MGYGNDDSGGRFIANSAAVALNVYDANTIGTSLVTEVTTGSAVGGTFTATGGVSLVSGDPILISLGYNGTTLTENFTDLTTKATYSTSNTINLASVVGGNTAYIGFGGGTGGFNTTQTISNFSFTSSPEPASLATLGFVLVGLMAPLVKRRRKLQA